MFWQLKQLLDHETNPSRPIVAGPSRSAGSGASAGIAAPARRHAERSERAGCGPWWIIPCFINQPFYHQARWYPQQQSWKMWRQLQPQGPKVKVFSHFPPIAHRR